MCSGINEGIGSSRRGRINRGYYRTGGGVWIWNDIRLSKREKGMNGAIEMCDKGLVDRMVTLVKTGFSKSCME